MKNNLHFVHVSWLVLVFFDDRLSGNAKKDVAVRHALAVRAAVTSNNYVVFFRLYKKAPNLNTHLMGMCVSNISFLWCLSLSFSLLNGSHYTDLYVEKMRFEAIRCICKSYRPGIPISYICRVLGFSKMDLQEDCMEYEDTNGLEECDDWLRAHGAVLTSDNKGEMQLDTKVHICLKKWKYMIIILVMFTK